MGTPTVVIVDDDPDLLSVITDVLRQDGPYRVTQLAAQTTTVDDISGAAPDLLILGLAFDAEDDG